MWVRVQVVRPILLVIAKASIRQRIKLFQMVKEARKGDVDSWAAVSGYNFGKDYIDYVATRWNKFLKFGPRLFAGCEVA